jgi:hypothetical protein
LMSQVRISILAQGGSVTIRVMRKSGRLRHDLGALHVVEESQ